MKKFFTRTAAASLALAAGASLFDAGAAQAANAPQAKHDLAVNYTVSSVNAQGYAGLVGIHVKNVGPERYCGEFPAVSLCGDVHTEKGREGVDRLITPGHFNGAYTEGLGFDEATSTHSYLVTLSNPVEEGQDQLVANLDFGDGATREGRLSNYVTVSQAGRLANDQMNANNQNVDSRTSTVSDSGTKLPGIF